MPHLEEFPNIANSFKKLKIGIQLEESLCTNTDQISFTILNGIRCNKLGEVLDFIRDQYHDNPPMMEKIIGKDLLKDIISL